MPSKITGMSEAFKTLADLKKGTAKSIGRRSLLPAANLIKETAVAKAPERTGNLKESGKVTTKVAKGTARAKRRAGDQSVEVYVMFDDPAAVPEEFGTSDTAADPFFRPAVDATKDRAFQMVADELTRITAGVAKRAANKAAKGK